MTRKKSRRLPIVLLVILVLLLLVFLLGIVKNQGGSRLEDLSATDQAILTEYNTLYASLLQEDIWTGYALEDKTILAMPGSWGAGTSSTPPSRSPACSPRRSPFRRTGTSPSTGWPP